MDHDADEMENVTVNNISMALSKHSFFFLFVLAQLSVRKSNVLLMWLASATFEREGGCKHNYICAKYVKQKMRKKKNLLLVSMKE